MSKKYGSVAKGSIFWKSTANKSLLNEEFEKSAILTNFRPNLSEADPFEFEFGSKGALSPRMEVGFAEEQKAKK